MIETILSALAVGTFWFWVTVLVSTIVFIASVENEHYATPTILTIVLGALFWTPIIALGWKVIVVGVGIYTLLGIFWSIFKWYRLVQKTKSSFVEKYGKILTESQMRDLKNEIRVSSHKSKLTGWIAFWPFSFAWSVTGDFFNGIYEFLTGLYQKIVERALGEFSVEKEDTTKETKTRY